MKTHFGNRGTWNDAVELRPATFPYADSARISEAPPRCDRCGGIWKEVSDGYQCRQCPRRWLAGDKLRELVGRTLESLDRWPVTRRG